MRVLRRRTVGVLIGLCLGWWGAGLAGPYLSSTAASVAGASAAQPAHEGGIDHGEGHGDATAALVPGAHERLQLGWYRWVLWSALGLFVAAIVLGIPSLALRGPDLPDPADAAGHGDGDGHH